LQSSPFRPQHDAGPAQAGRAAAGRVDPQAAPNAADQTDCANVAPTRDLDAIRMALEIRVARAAAVDVPASATVGQVMALLAKIRDTAPIDWAERFKSFFSVPDDACRVAVQGWFQSWGRSPTFNGLMRTAMVSGHLDRRAKWTLEVQRADADRSVAEPRPQEPSMMPPRTLLIAPPDGLPRQGIYFFTADYRAGTKTPMRVALERLLNAMLPIAGPDVEPWMRDGRLSLKAVRERGLPERGAISYLVDRIGREAAIRGPVFLTDLPFTRDHVMSAGDGSSCRMQDQGAAEIREFTLKIQQQLREGNRLFGLYLGMRRQDDSIGSAFPERIPAQEAGK
jgi:hypothetical protein